MPLRYYPENGVHYTIAVLHRFQGGTFHVVPAVDRHLGDFQSSVVGLNQDFALDPEACRVEIQRFDGLPGEGPIRIGSPSRGL